MEAGVAGLSSDRKPQSGSQRSGSWSLTPADGAYAALPAWTSARAWMALVERVLGSERATQLRGKKISVGSAILVARADMAAADVRTGRGVSTSHETVAKRLGMSKRTVGEARRLLEKLGLAVTVVMGRHLSPAERSQAKRLHGRYQEAAASVRALVMPRPTSPVDTCHLPRRGSVLKTSPVQKWSPTRAGARETAASRPKPRRRSTRRVAPPTSPRPIEVQRFTWAVARNYGLDAGGPPTATGALHGGRHIGQLSNILQRYDVTPDRYTLATLRAELDEAMAAAKILPLENGQKRDRLAHFAWMLSKLQTFTRGETRLQRQLREHADLLTKRRSDLDAARQAERERQRLLEEDQSAREAIIEQLRRHSLRRQPASAAQRAASAKALVTALIGHERALYALPVRTQQLVGEISALDKCLTMHGWHPEHDVAAGAARWRDSDNGEELVVALVDGAEDAVRVRVVLPHRAALPSAASDIVGHLASSGNDGNNGNDANNVNNG